MPVLTKALQDTNKNVRVAAATSITNLLNPPTADDVPLLVSLLKHNDAEVRVYGTRGLAKLGKNGKNAVPDLVEAAKSPDAGVRRGAIESLAVMGGDPKVVVPVFVAALKEATDSATRLSALQALAPMGKDLEKDKDTIAAILETVKDADAQVKKAALTTIGKLGPAIGPTGAKQIMPTVLELLEDKESSNRDQALDTIAGLGPLAKDAIPPLITMMERKDIKLYKDKSNKVFIQEADDQFLDKIAKTLGKIGVPAVKPLMRGLNTTNVNAGLVIGCCRALGEVGPAAKDSLTILTEISQANLPAPLCFEADRAMRKIRAK
jgi:HEAT repeat protein